MKRFFRDALNAPPQNQLHLAECSRRKIRVVGCDVICGVGALKVRSKLGLGAKPATPKNALHSATRPQLRIRTPAKSIAPSPLQPPKIRRKICVVGGEVICGVCTQSLDFKPFLLIAPLSSFFLKKIRNSTSRKEIILALFTVVPKVAPVL